MASAWTRFRSPTRRIPIPRMCSRPVRQEPLPKRSEGIDIMLCIDTSSSMRNNDLDVRRTRLEVARQAAEQFYERLRSHWPDPARVLAGSVAPAPSDWDFDAPFAEQMMLSDLVQYLPDDILTKVDRASMAVSLEARVPLLDHHIVELAWRLPRRMKIRGRTQKWILRQVLSRHVPSHLFERPKTGFGVPVGDWIKGPLEGWAASLLDEGRLVQDGIFDPAAGSTAWAAHKQGRGNHGQRLWAILMFQSWWATNRQAIEA